MFVDSVVFSWLFPLKELSVFILGVFTQMMTDAAWCCVIERWKCGPHYCTCATCRVYSAHVLLGEKLTDVGGAADHWKSQRHVTVTVPWLQRSVASGTVEPVLFRGSSTRVVLWEHASCKPRFQDDEPAEGRCSQSVSRTYVSCPVNRVQGMTPGGFSCCDSCLWKLKQSMWVVYYFNAGVW